MPLDIGTHVKRELRTITVPFPEFGIDPETGEVPSVTLTYDPLKYNWRFDEFAREQAFPAYYFKEALLSFVVEWDLTEDGEPVPLSEDGLAELGMVEEVQWPLLRAILDDVREGKRQANDSPTPLPGAKRRSSGSRARGRSRASR